MNFTNNMTDQAGTLRLLASSIEGIKKCHALLTPAMGWEGTRVISVTSGKGGVGKSSVAVNLGVALARQGKRILIIDADLGLANLDILMGLKPLYTMNHVLSGEKSLKDIIVSGPAGVKLVPAGFGEQKYTSLGKFERLCLLDALDRLEEDFDIIIIDTEAGISENVTFFNVAAQEIMVVVSPEPAALSDSFALIRLLLDKYGERRFHVLVNMANDATEAEEVFERFSQMGGGAGISLDYLGCVTRDEKMVEAVKRQRALMDIYPESEAAGSFEKLALRIAERPTDNRLKGNIQFFLRKFPVGRAGLERV